MAIWRKRLSLGLAKRRSKSRLWMSLTMSQLTFKWWATSWMVGHAPRQLQGVAFEGLGVGAPGVGKVDPGLAGESTVPAEHPRDRQSDDRGSPADRQREQVSLRVPARADLARATDWAAQGLLGLLDREDHFATKVFGPDIVITPDTEGMVQQAGGHVGPPLSRCIFPNLRWDQYVRPSSTPRASVG